MTQEQTDRLIHTAENVLISYSMGWDMDAAMLALKEALDRIKAK